jgi:trans-AT polyketide synthase/acyltransferase/oxidoreductase domain-containing protein
MQAYLFPGQGAQFKGMGATLFDQFPALTAQADQVLGYSIKACCLADPGSQLDQTQFTQPALYVVNALSYLKKVNETGERPDYVAGHSLGEYNALFAAGAFDFATGLKLVKKRGELMSAATGGGMAAVVGMTPERITELLEKNDLTGIDIANYNAPTQTVIAGFQAEVARAVAVLQAAKATMVIPLNVSGAFHSRYMAGARADFAEFIEGFTFGDLVMPVIANVTALPYRQSEVKANLVRQMISSVRWSDSIRYLMGLGEISIKEVGAGRILTGLLRANQMKGERSHGQH